ncbi:MAG TPA: polysaccharide biosynthesis tyrosine autokinase [Actinomycetota bacterium]|nr:polysaccharide biosynthesis tyrosine autokinase [Actinomycetota bacterium]
MARPNPGDPPANPAALSPFQTPASGLPAPAATTTPYGPPGWAGGPAPSGPRNAPTVGGLINSLKRRWVMATFLGGIVAGAVAVAIWLLLPAGKHSARSDVELKMKGPDLVNRQGEDFEAFRREQMFHVRTRDLITRTLAEPAVAGLETIRSSDDPVRFLEENLQVSMPAPTIMVVTLTGDNPDDLKVLVDTLVRKYVDDATSYDRANRDSDTKKLEKLAEQFKQEIQARQRQIQTLAEAGSTIGVEGEAAKQARIQQSIGQLDSEVFAKEAEIQDLTIQRSYLRGQLKDNRVQVNAVDLARLVDMDFRVAALIGQRTEKGFLLAREREQAASPDAPTIKNLEDQIARIEKTIEQRRAVVKPEIEANLQHDARRQVENQAIAVEDKLNKTAGYLEARKKLRDDLQKRLVGEGKAALDVTMLMKELDPQREYLSKIEASLVSLRITKELESRVRVKSPAMVLLNQNQKQKTLLASGGGVLAFLGMLGLIGFLEWRNRRIDGVDQVVNELGMRVIGTVPAFPNRANLKAAEAAGNANWRFVLNESINSARTMLLHTARHQSMQVVMVTSATQGEGKTSLASQLATSMATAGMRTLLVDCDLRNPSIHKLFDLGLTAGVSEVLRQEADVSDAVQPTHIPNLWAIPAGQCSNGVITALAQGHPLETLFNRLRGQFDFIIVDSCPVLPVADALLVGQHVDGVVFSIMQDISQLPKVLVASEKLAQLNIPLVGAVVNGIRSADMYSYGYNYIKQLPA